MSLLCISKFYYYSLNIPIQYCILYDASNIMVRVFTNGPGDQGLIPGRVIPKTKDGT